MSAYALTGAVGYGASDFFGGVAARRTPIAFVMVTSQLTSLVLMVIAGCFVDGYGTTTGDLIRGIIGGALVFAGIALVYAAFSTGDIGPAASLLGVFSAAVPVAAAVVTGDSFRWSVLVGVAAAFCAILAFSDGESRPGARISGLLAALGGSAFGAYHVTMSGTNIHAGVTPLIFAQIVVVLLSCFWLAGGSWTAPVRSVPFPRLAVVAGGVEAAASVAALYAVRTGNLAVVGIILALSPAASVMLARLVLGERLTRRRAGGLAAATVAVVVMAGAA